MPVVMCTPGASGAERSFRDVTPLWPRHVRPVCHDIAGLTGASSLHDYTWQSEVDRLHSHVESIDTNRVHLLGFSAGATLMLAYLAAHPERVAGVGFIEPAWSFLPLTDVEQDYFAALDRVFQMPPAEQRTAFLRLLLRDDIVMPARDPMWNRPYEQAERPADTPLAVVTRAMRAHQLPPGGLASFAGPAYVAIGALSSPMWHAQCMQLGAALPRYVMETYLSRHHLDTPLHNDPPHLVRALLATWDITEPG